MTTNHHAPGYCQLATGNWLLTTGYLPPSPTGPFCGKRGGKEGAVGLKLFIPCFIDQGAPQIGAATVELLHRLRVPWEYPEDQTCCGRGGAFQVQHADLAREMGETYLEAVRQPALMEWCHWITVASCTSEA